MKHFREYITEMANTPQQGFQYEKNAAAALKRYDIVPTDFIPAGAGSEQPDLLIKKPGTPNFAAVGCELKITAASAGSLVMKYNSGKWSIGNENETNDEKLFIMDLAKEVGVIDLINQKWKAEPLKGTGLSAKAQQEASTLSTRERYQRDLSMFSDIKGEIPASKIETYYNRKKTYYINVGTHGFYRLGDLNPLGLKGVPSFGSAARAKYRARVQYKGKGNYQFTFEMQFTIPASLKSPYNIAPISGNSVEIKNLNLDWFK